MPVIRFHGRKSRLPNDSVATPPVPGVWYVGERPAYTTDAAGNDIIPAFTEFDFSADFCAAIGRQCWQVTGRPCDDGNACTHEALQFTEAWNLALDQTRKQTPQPFEISEPPQAPHSPTAAHTAR